MVMMMPPCHGALLRADDAGVFEHFAAVFDGLDIPVMVQDAPLPAHARARLLAMAADLDLLALRWGR